MMQDHWLLCLYTLVHLVIAHSASLDIGGEALSYCTGVCGVCDRDKTE
jgi:hypothetical protein